MIFVFDLFTLYTCNGFTGSALKHLRTQTGSNERNCYMVAEIVAYFLLILIFSVEIEMSPFHSMLLLVSLCPTGFEFRSILLLDWFSTKAREPGLLCYLYHSLGVKQKKWIHGIFVKVNVMILAGI